MLAGILIISIISYEPNIIGFHPLGDAYLYPIVSSSKNA